MEFDEYGNPIMPQLPPPTFGQQIGNFFGVGPEGRQLQQYGMSDPRAAAWSQALNNIVQMNMGQAPRIAPYSAAFDVRRQNAILMDRKYQANEEKRRWQEAQKLRELQMQVAEHELKQSKNMIPNPYGNLPKEAQMWKMSNSKLPLEEWLTKTNASSHQLPADVQTYLFAQGLSPEQKSEFLGTRFAPVPVKIGDVTYLVNKGTGAGTAIGPDGMTDFADINAVIQQQAASKETATTTAAEQAKVNVAKQSSAPADLATGEQLISLIDMATQHPGRESATGASSVFNSVAVPGSDRRDFLTLGEQLKGNAFLQAYQSLKGGGPITDREGAAATAAQSRLNEAQSEGGYLQALEEMKRLTQERLSRIPQSSPDGSGKPKPTKRYNPATGKLEAIP